MATFNFNADNIVHGSQYIAGRDLHISSADTLAMLNALLRDTRSATATGNLTAEAGAEASAEITQAIDVLSGEEADGPQRAERFLARAREALVAAALVPGLVEGVTRAIEAIRNMS
jgi:anthranilate phosphoribosyltransferase